jgi:hypothetical protein
MKAATSSRNLRVLIVAAIIVSYSSVAFQYWRIYAAHRDLKRWNQEYKVVHQQYKAAAAELKRRKIAPPPPVIHGADD